MWRIDFLKKKIAVVTGTRAEYGILEPLIKKIYESDVLELHLYVTAMHLSDYYGHTVNDITYPIAAEINIDIRESNTRKDMLHSVDLGIQKFSELLRREKPDLIVLLGDRMEQLGAAIPAFFLGIPIAHIHGGDLSSGLDNTIRDMITKMASIHFPASKQSAERIKSMGIDENTIHLVGAPGLDSILSMKLESKNKLSENYNLNPDKKWALVLFHSDTLCPERSGKDMRAILDAVDKLDLQKIIIYPNADVGGELIISEIMKNSEKPDHICLKSMGHNDFISLISHCEFIIGNSSSAIIEAPSLGIPAINIGSRENNRERGDNVIDIPDVDPSAISAAIEKALNDKSFLETVKKKQSPYGDGTASDKIMDLLQIFDFSSLKNTSDKC